MPYAMHSNWRDCQEWRKYNVPLSTTSNEAVKLYDATLTQYVGWFDEPSVGGMEGSIGKLSTDHPEFVMGHVLKNGLELMGTGRSPLLDKEFQDDIDKMDILAGKSKISHAEKLHVEAVKLCSKGEWYAAALLWEDVLVDHPLDMLALKFLHDCYFYMGKQPQMRDSVARVMPHWKPDMPLYCYLYGQYSFGLIETNFYDQAEKLARKGLELNKHDGWAIHSMAHVFEMGGRADEGITFMSSTVQNWEPCQMLACHNFWHWAVYHIEKGEYQGAFDIFDSKIGPRASNSGSMLDIVDTCSMLFRLEMEGQNVGDRWNDIYEVCRPHIDDHLLCFNDMHMLLSLLGSNHMETAEKMMNSIEDFIRNNSGSRQQNFKDVGHVLAQAFVAYKEGDYAKTVNLMTPIKYDILSIGGSNAQRDLFNLLHIHAALRSPLKEHHRLARHLLVERKALKENSPMTDRLVARAMAQHVD